MHLDLNLYTGFGSATLGMNVVSLISNLDIAMREPTELRI